MIDQTEILRKYIAESEAIVFFGGAGVSTESGIPDFRSEDGVYNQKYDYPAETIISRDFFFQNTKYFYDFYRSKMIFPHAAPNKAHVALAKLEKTGKLKAVVTQNIDSLHHMAGSKNVFELHGSIYRNYCVTCGRAYGIDAVLNTDGVPLCECGGIIRPDVVLFGESLNNQVIFDAISFIKSADMLIIGGTSLGVYPAAGLVEHYSGNKLVLINKSATPIDQKADLLIHDSIGDVLGRATE